MRDTHSTHGGQTQLDMDHGIADTEVPARSYGPWFDTRRNIQQLADYGVRHWQWGVEDLLRLIRVPAGFDPEWKRMHKEIEERGSFYALMPLDGSAVVNTEGTAISPHSREAM